MIPKEVMDKIEAEAKKRTWRHSQGQCAEFIEAAKYGYTLREEALTDIFGT